MSELSLVLYTVVVLLAAIANMICEDIRENSIISHLMQGVTKAG